MRYAFIGLGRLGRVLASNLTRAGFTVSVYDRDVDAASSVVALGARWASSPRDVASNTDAVITCLPSPAQSAEVLDGAEGVLAGLVSGGTWIEMSTSDPQEVQRMAKIAAGKGIHTLEVPVTGGIHRAAVGEMTAFVGGERSVYESHLPALQGMCGRILYMGALGSASTIKLITNMLCFIQLVATGEALMLAKRSGLDLGEAFDAIKASSANGVTHEDEGQLILSGSYNIGFTMDLACKDMGLAMKIGRETGVPLEIAGLVEQTFIRARESYGGKAWSTRVVKLLEDALHTDLRAPGFPESLTSVDQQRTNSRGLIGA
jgi:3-hydroxyisobutyrate dehydrogenase